MGKSEREEEEEEEKDEEEAKGIQLNRHKCVAHQSQILSA